MSVTINRKTFNAEYLTTPKEHANGMMGRTHLDGCVVFKMERGEHSFWMKSCLIPLDIVFVLNKRISHIHHNCPVEDRHRMTLPRYTGIGDHVIEFPARTAEAEGWKVGDMVKIKAPKTLT